MNRPIITLTTDFGLSDSYVAQMKGVILEIAPDVRLVDVTHQIPPQDLAAASAVLADAVGVFPPETIHLVVVDPGVGTGRRAVAVEANAPNAAARQRFVAPDNGVLTGALQNCGVNRVVRLVEQRFFRTPISHTFHGRDISPVAAHWSRGVDLGEFGPPLDSPLIQIAAEPPRRDGNLLCGRIVRTDSFGNLITNIDASQLEAEDRTRFVVEIGGKRIQGLSRCYGDRETGETVALFGSSGFLEIAVSGGHAGQILAARSGDPVVVIRTE